MIRSLSIIGLVLSLLILWTTQGVVSFRQRTINTSLSNKGADVKIESLPLDLGDWKGEAAGTLGQMERGILRLDRWLKRNYTHQQLQPIYFYLGYWKHQTGDYQAAKHSPLVCFPSNGWQIYDTEQRAVSLASNAYAPNFKVSRLVGEIEGSTYVTYYWFFTGERVYTQDWQAMLHSSFETLLSGRSDGGIVEITAKVDPNSPKPEAIAKAQQAVESFIAVLQPELGRLISAP